MRGYVMANLEIENLTKCYAIQGSAPIHALNDVSFAIERGESFGLVGVPAVERRRWPSAS